MNKLTKGVVSSLIQNFLSEQLNKKLEPEQKSLEKALTEGDAELVSKIQETINQLEQKYALDNWMSDAANRMAKQLKFGTHIAKGVHPDAKGDNINFSEFNELDSALVGSHSIDKLEIDANGNAAALPLASFFNTPVGDYKLRDLIRAQHSGLKGCFASDPAVSDAYQQMFKSVLDNAIESPCTSELNKQLLWPLDGVESATTDSYICLIPLHPSALTHHFHKSINGARYSEANKLARDNRKKKTAEQAAYLTMHDLAYVQLGGTKPQNVSQLTSGQGGRNYLLPSLPPQMAKERGLRLNKRQTTLFDRRLEYQCRWGFEELFAVIDAFKNNVDVRDRRKEAFDLILNRIVGVAKQIQQDMPPGWSKDYNLNMAEKYWLDADRGELEDEESFKSQREQVDWYRDIVQAFSYWVQQIVKKQFPKQADEFDDAEMREWRKEMREAIKASLRREEGVF